MGMDALSVLALGSVKEEGGDPAGQEQNTRKSSGFSNHNFNNNNVLSCFMMLYIFSKTLSVWN